MTDLPPGWEWATLGEVISSGLFVDGDWIESKDQDPEGGIRLVQLADIGVGQFRDRSNRYLNASVATRLRCTELVAGDILVARMPEPLGRACLVPVLSTPAITAVDVCILRPNTTGVDSAWMMWFLNAPQVRSQVLLLQSGSTRKRISRLNLSTVRIAVPPRAEQKRIVAAIEEHLSQIDAAEAALRSARARLSDLSASSTAAAVSGDWPVARLGDHTVGQQYGSSAKASRDGDIPILRMGNIVDGRLDFSDLKFLQHGHPDADKYVLQPGDLLFNRTNSPELVGKAAVFEGYPGRVVFASYLIRVRLDRSLDPHWAATIINSVSGRRYIEMVRTQQVGQANVNGSKLRDFPIPLPSVAVQHSQLARLSQAQEWRALVDTEILRAIGRSATMRRSILAAAFSGRLVPQDPADEPASVLLERIAAERASTTVTRRRKAVTS
jgi:type I restriction enzyme S subunit